MHAMRGGTVAERRLGVNVEPASYSSLILAWASGVNRLKPGHPTTSDASARCSVCRLQAARGQNETSPIFKRALRPRTGS